jgi:hypothetical protein
MPSLNADKLIGQKIYAAKTLSAYNSTFKTKVQTFQKGDLIGIVYSWVTDRKNNVNYLQFQSSGNRYYYVKIAPGNFQLTSEVSARIEQVKQQETQQKQVDEIAQKGQFVYYFEKYGKIALIALIGTIIVTTYIKKKV